MKILLACQQSPHTYPIPAYHFWRPYFCEGLAEAGHTVLEVAGADWARGLLQLDDGERQQWSTATWSRTVDTVKAAKTAGSIDLFLAYLYPNQVDVSAVQAIRDLGVPCVNFFCDNLRELRRVPATYRPFDLHWVPEKGALPMYQRAGLPHLNAPMPAWIEPRLRTSEHPETYGPTFIGSADSVRVPFLAEAAALGARFTVRGRGWTGEPAPRSPTVPAAAPLSLGRRLGYQWAFLREHGLAAWIRRNTPPPKGPAPVLPASHIAPDGWVDDYFAVTQQSSIVIGLNRYPSFHFPADHPGTYSRLRDLEAPMLGACYLTEWAEGLDDLYELGTEIETFRDAPELKAKIEQLLADPERRRRMRRAGQRRALADHTVGRTIARIAERLGLGGR